MKYYTSIAEKKEYFLSGDKLIDKIEDLLKIINKIGASNKNHDTLFRGQPEAKFKLYNSLQRLWVEKQLGNHYENYSVLIGNLIKNCKEWNNGIIPKFLNNSVKSENDISYLSIMQHYGLQTPMLDFTYNINKSLFFAIENIDFAPANTEIDKYFSIYWVYKKNSALFVTDFFIDKVLEYSKRNNLNKNKDLSTALQFEIVLVDSHDTEFRIQNNLNILNQEGAFIFNSSPTEPLEIQHLIMKGMIDMIAKKLKLDIKFPKEAGGCLNINKSLVPDIKSYLNNLGINSNTIYPDLSQLKFDCLNKEWNNISANQVDGPTSKN